MKFKKLGLIAKPLVTAELQQSHMQAPKILKLDDGGNFRLYFGSRCCDSKSRLFTATIDLNNLVINARSSNPIIPLGNVASFDENGMIPGSIIFEDGKYYLFYTAYAYEVGRPVYKNSIGLATSADGINFTKVSTSPYIDRSPESPIGCGAPIIYKTNDSYKMIYFATEYWNMELDGTYSNLYQFKMAHGGLKITDQFIKENKVLFSSNTNKHQGTGQVIKIKDYYYFFFCFATKEEPYRIGFAVSTDGVNFERRDDLLEIEKGKEGEFDSEMMCYPCVVEYNNKLYMFYNGNKNGRDGIGLAICEDYQL